MLYMHTASLLYGEQPLMQYTLPVAMESDLRLCVNVRIEIHVCSL